MLTLVATYLPLRCAECKNTRFVNYSQLWAPETHLRLAFFDWWFVYFVQSVCFSTVSLLTRGLVPSASTSVLVGLELDSRSGLNKVFPDLVKTQS